MYDLSTYKVGEMIRKARRAQKMSIEELASKIGKNSSTVYKYERDEVEINIYTMFEICNALNIDISDLMDKENIEIEKSASKNPFNTDKLFLYYIGFEDIIAFELEIKNEKDYQKVYLKSMRRQ